VDAPAIELAPARRWSRACRAARAEWPHHADYNLCRTLGLLTLIAPGRILNKNAHCIRTRGFRSQFALTRPLSLNDAGAHLASRSRRTCGLAARRGINCPGRVSRSRAPGRNRCASVTSLALAAARPKGQS